MEVQLCRDQVKRLVSLSMWISLQEGRRNQEFKTVPKWRKYWRAIQKKDKPELMEKLNWERLYLQRLMIKFMKVLEGIPEEGDVGPHAIRRNQEFKTVPKWRKYWRAIQKKDKPELMEKLNWERLYLQRLMIKFMR
ncbi:Intron-binding protein aquarius, partial [Operophtera brumata]